VSDRFINAAYLDAVLASNLDAREKLVLFGLVFYMDDKTHETYIGNPTLCEELGYSDKSKTTLIAARKELEKWGVISKTGEHRKNPSANYHTNVVKIDFERLKVLARPDRVTSRYKLPSTSSSELPSSSPLPNHTEVRDCAGGEIADIRPPVVLTSQPKGESSNSQQSTVDSSLSTSSMTDQNQHQEQKPNPRGFTPNPARGLLVPETPRQDNSAPRPPVPPPPAPDSAAGEIPCYTGAEIDDLVWIFVNYAPGGKFLNWDSQVKAVEFHSLGGPKFPAARVAFLMFWAFSRSDWWTVAKNWDCTMAGFLRAIRKIDNQCREYFKKKHDKVASVHKTTASMRKFLTPAAVPDNPEATGTVQCRLCEMFVEAATVTDGLCRACHDEEHIEPLPTAECAGEHQLRVPVEQLDADGFCWRCQIERKKIDQGGNE
jgi:hypothetical protein